MLLIGTNCWQPKVFQNSSNWMLLLPNALHTTWFHTSKSIWTGIRMTMQSWARSWWRLEFQLIRYLVSALWTPTCLQPLRSLVRLNRLFQSCVMFALLFLIWVNEKLFSGRPKTYCFPISVWTALFALRLQVQLQTVTRKNIWTRSPCWKKCTASTLYSEAE